MKIVHGGGGMRPFRVLHVKWISLLELPFRNMVFDGYYFCDFLNVIFDVLYEV